MTRADAEADTNSNRQMTVLAADSTELCRIWLGLGSFRKTMANQSCRTHKGRERARVYDGQRPHHQCYSNEEQHGQGTGERRPKGQDLNSSEGKEDDERYAVEPHLPCALAIDSPDITDCVSGSRNCQTNGRNRKTRPDFA